MILEALDQELSVCKVADYSMVDLDGGMVFIGSTGEERSLVCETRQVPSNATDRSDGWRALRVAGPLDFSLVGVLAGISAVLADAGVPVYVVSTFDTDYVLVRSGDLPDAISALEDAGYTVRRDHPYLWRQPSGDHD